MDVHPTAAEKRKAQLITIPFQKTQENRKFGLVSARQDNFNLSTSTVCSLHFTNDDYVRDMHAELMNLSPTKVLKADAVPSVNLPGYAIKDNARQ